MYTSTTKAEPKFCKEYGNGHSLEGDDQERRRAPLRGEGIVWSTDSSRKAKL